MINDDIKFVQDNESISSLNVLRGMHYQKKPYEQSKLIRVVDGEIFDVAVDLRTNSSTMGKWVGEILSSKNKRQLWIPRGFAHGFQVLSKSATVLYKTDNFYSKEHEVCFKYNDPFFDIKWPLMSNLILSLKDSNGLLYEDYIRQLKNE